MNENRDTADRRVAFRVNRNDDDFYEHELREGLLAADGSVDFRLGDSERTIDSQEIDAEYNELTPTKGAPHVHRGSLEA